MQDAGLTAQALFCQRGDRRLFGALDLHLRPGAALHLVGPNGIGKSSLIAMLAGLLAPSPGQGTTLGRVTWTGRPGLLDGRCPLDGHLPLQQALAFWAALDGHPVQLDAVGLAGLAPVPVRFLSTGQRKRASLAVLLAQAADHWLLDEPLNGLDRDGVALVERLIAGRRAAGGIVVVASHQPLELPGAARLDLRDHPW